MAITMQAPAGASGSFGMPSGTSYTISNGVIAANAADVSALLGLGFVIRGSNDFRARLAPAGYSAFDADFQITGGGAPGQFALQARAAAGDGSALAYFTNKFAADLNSTAVYIAPWGSDSNNGAMATPYLTLNKGLRSVSASYVYLMGFTERNPIKFDDYRASDTGAGALKIVRGLGRRQVIGIPGPDASLLTWTNSSGTYTTTLASGFPARVLYYPDNGDPVPLLSYASAASLTGTVWGWNYNSGTAVLSVRLGGADVTIARSQLRIVCNGTSTSSAGDPRLLIYNGARIVFDNICFDGAYPYALGVGATQSWLAAQNCVFQYADNYGVFVDSSNSFLQNCRILRSKSDGVNYKDTANTPTFLVEHNVVSEYAGDIDTFGSAGGWIVNGSSNDSAGPVVRINGAYRYSAGPTLPDKKSWNCGVVAGPSAVPFDQATGVTGADFLAQTAGSIVWCDACLSGGSRYGFFAYGAGTTLSMANCDGGSSTSTGGAIASYSP
jgi:hypothetical protein